MHFPPFNEEVSRFERKFAIRDMDYNSIHQQVKLNSAAFSPLYYPRHINNIYLDTPELQYFLDNVSGIGDRIKARIRWYKEQKGFIEKPVLEFKIRKGFLGNKISFPLASFSLDEHFSNQLLVDVFKRSDLPLWTREVLANLSPSLLNRYKRKYLISFDERYRITLDSELSYYHIGNNTTFMESYTSDDVIVELKYAKINDDDAIYITNNLPFRLTKSSKYVNGIELLHPQFG